MTTSNPSPNLSDHAWIALQSAVQLNCDIADARHSGDYQMCTYLMKMREYFRWEQGYRIGERLPKDELGDWLTEREMHWNEVGDADFQPIPIQDEIFQPFDAIKINHKLAEFGLVYSAGLTESCRANFYLGELTEQDQIENCCALWQSGREYSRAMHAPAAMSQEKRIFLRFDALKRYLWEKFETWSFHSPDSALGRAFAEFDLKNAPVESIEAMAARILPTVRAHEIGEVKAEQFLADDWKDMLLSASGTPLEIQARAIRDLYADCAQTLPLIAQTQDAVALHFLVGNLSNMRKSLFPTLIKEYDRWRDRQDWQPLVTLAQQSADHWRQVSQMMLKAHQAETPVMQIRDQVEARVF